MLFVAVFIGETFHVRLASNPEGAPVGTGALEQLAPFAITLHVPPQGFPEKLAHRAVLALGQILGFEQEIRRKGDRNGFGNAHQEYCKTMINNVKVDEMRLVVG